MPPHTHATTNLGPPSSHLPPTTDASLAARLYGSGLAPHPSPLHAGVCVCVCVGCWCEWATHTQTQTKTHRHTRTNKHAHTHIRIHKHRHTQTHMQTQTLAHSLTFTLTQAHTKALLLAVVCQWGCKGPQEELGAQCRCPPWEIHPTIDSFPTRSRQALWAAIVLQVVVAVKPQALAWV